MIGESAWYHWADPLLTASVAAKVFTRPRITVQYLLTIPILASCAPQQQSPLH